MCNLFKDNVERPSKRKTCFVSPMLKFCSSLKLMNLHVVCLTIIIFLWCMFCLEQIFKSAVLLMVHKWRDTIWGYLNCQKKRGKVDLWIGGQRKGAHTIPFKDLIFTRGQKQKKMSLVLMSCAWAICHFQLWPSCECSSGPLDKSSLSWILKWRTVNNVTVSWSLWNVFLLVILLRRWASSKRKCIFKIHLWIFPHLKE